MFTVDDFLSARCRIGFFIGETVDDNVGDNNRTSGVGENILGVHYFANISIKS
jgi:hypothetical protein